MKMAKKDKKRIPPHDIDAEIAVIGAMMLSTKAISIVIEKFSSDTAKQTANKIKEDPSKIFYDLRHQEIYKSLIELYKENTVPDAISLLNHLRKMGTLDMSGGSHYVNEISLLVPTWAKVEDHAKIVLEHYFKRCLIEVADEILENCYDDTSDALEEIESAEKHIFAIAEKRISRTYKSLATLTSETMALVNQIFSNTEATDTVTTGFHYLDNLLNGGFHKSDLIILAARPSMGKTAFALALAANAAMKQIPVGFFSLEMNSMQITLRLLSSMEFFNAPKTLRLKQKSDIDKITSGLGKLATLPIFFDDTPSISLNELRAKCRRMQAEHNVGFIVIDYLQLVQSYKAESREREISIISSVLKQIARELEVPVLALSQLNRAIEERIFSGKKVNAARTPILSDLRESGSIEQDADVVMFIHRPEAVLKNEPDKDEQIEKNNWAGLAQIVVEKHRNGATGKVDLTCFIECGRFVAREHNYAESNKNNTTSNTASSSPPPHTDFSDDVNF